jgi:C-terminal processing protease CtpA/Prc
MWTEKLHQSSKAVCGGNASRRTTAIALLTIAFASQAAEMGALGVWIVDRRNAGEPLRTGKVFPKSPADKAGIKSDWYLISVNGTNVVDIPVKESMRIMRGAVGTKVTLELTDSTRSKTNKFTVKRGKAVFDANDSVVEITD